MTKKKLTLLTMIATLSLFAVACQKSAPPPRTAGDEPAGGEETKAEAHKEAHWGYEGAGAPANWGDLKPEFAVCKTGTEQSPINVTGATAGDLAPLAFNYKAGDWKIVDNGHTIQVNLPPGSTVDIRGTTYELLQFHFHAKSENQLEGRYLDMEVHLVHKNAEGKLAVVGVWMEGGGEEHPLIAQVWQKIPQQKGEEVAVAGSPLDPAGLLPADQTYFHWEGSLTTPPCSEGVDWNMMKTPISISAEQLSAFQGLYPNNYRPVQPLNERTLTVSK